MKIITVGNTQAAVIQELHADVLQVVVPVFRTPEETTAALEFAATLSEGLNWSVRLVDVQAVPFHCTLELPPINREFSESRLQALAAAVDVPVRADLVYARAWDEGFDRLLRPESLVVLATRKRFWKTAEERLAARLTRQGHHLILVECK